ncbi:apoptosis regulator Bcl-2-like [Archocentrus centrarchus]|uniref:apoptosis regulator Bcl-2-like n=1 Tax=Archocentrus centrarchus TaxID=63155 RepID=UPI0011EA1CE2|nr:apoptosis regulator Bcl-2-like [Archocentrus centrarchus]
MAAAYSSRDIVEDYLHYKLLCRGVAWPSAPPPHRPGQRRANDVGAPRQDPRVAPPRLQSVLRSAGDELERLYGAELSAQVSVLRLRGDGGDAARLRNMTAIREELFRDGVNWGRIVTMMELGGALSAEVAMTGDTGHVDDIAGWMEESLDSPLLQRWIQDNGGWDAFMDLYESRPADSFWALSTMFGLVVLGAAVVILGFLFSQK